MITLILVELDPLYLTLKIRTINADAITGELKYYCQTFGTYEHLSKIFLRRALMQTMQAV